MKAFKRRIYHSLGEVLTDFRTIWSRRGILRKAMDGTESRYLGASRSRYG
jgi:hypothetical protein